MTQHPAPEDDCPHGSPVLLAFETRLLSFGTIDGPRIAPHGTPAPDVSGLNIEEAIRRLTEAGFIAVTFQPRRPVDTLEVSKQKPLPGAPVGRFREVALWLDER